MCLYATAIFLRSGHSTLFVTPHVGLHAGTPFKHFARLCSLFISTDVIILSMQTLRNAHYLARFVLVWFALFLGVAIASPIVNPNPTQLVCSASGTMKVVSAGDDVDGTVAGHTLECPLCTGTGIDAPPSLALVDFVLAQPLAYAVQSIASARIASATTAPLPARGPP